ncbi:MAG TPA: hypothetical protein VFO69_08580 [Allosphingosinicella sp.]|nr:hypothetical protein [Allosphingosinicella sp.]
MTSWIFLLYAAGHLALFGWALILLLRHRHPATVPLLIVTFGLVYDNVVLAGGAAIGHGELLERLSVPRFFMHAFGTPLLMLSALGLMRRSGAQWSRTSLPAVGIAALTLAMIAVGVEADLIGLELAPKAPDGVISYGNAASHGPPVAPVVTIIVLVIAGIVLWRRKVGAWLLIGALVQFAAAAIGDAIVIAGNFGELALLAGLVMSDARLSLKPNAVSTRA